MYFCKDILLPVALMSFLLSSCNSSDTQTDNNINPGRQEDNMQQEEANPFEGLDFPLARCSDELPSTETEYPTQVWSVIIDQGSDFDFNELSLSYCSDANQSHLTEDQSMILAQFSSEERAIAFQEVISSDFPSTNVIGPTLVEWNQIQFDSASALIIKCGISYSVNSVLIESMCPVDLDRDSRPDHSQIILRFSNPTQQSRSLTFVGFIHYRPAPESYDLRTLAPQDQNEDYYIYYLSPEYWSTNSPGLLYFDENEPNDFSSVTLDPGESFGIRYPLEDSEQENKFYIGGGKLKYDNMSESEKLVISCERGKFQNEQSVFGLRVAQQCSPETRMFHASGESSPVTNVIYDNNAGEKRGALLETEINDIAWSHLTILNPGGGMFDLSMYSDTNVTLYSQEDLTLEHLVFIP